MGVVQIDLRSIGLTSLGGVAAQNFPNLRKLERAPLLARPTQSTMASFEFSKKWAREEVEATSTHEARMVCESALALLEQPEPVLSRLRGLARSEVMDRKCWYLLILAYFKPDLESSVASGVAGIAEILREQRARFVPTGNGEGTRWQKALHRWPTILDPAAEEVFYTRTRVSREEAEKLLVDVGAASDSRFYQTLILRDARELIDLDNSRFLAAVEPFIDTLLAKASRHEAIVRSALGMLLERFSKDPGLPPCMKLKDVILLPEHFGHPSILANSPRWSNVSAEAKAMLVRWVSRWDLEHFFEVLDSQGGASRDRLRFWRGYIDQMTGTQIVFGQDAHRNSTTGFHGLREVLMREKRYCRLSDGAGDNNAFVFRIKGYTFVEFGAHGKGACYVYAPDELPPGMIRFDMRPPPLIEEGVLKARNPGDDFRWVHNSGWEERFRIKIHSLRPRATYTAPLPVEPRSSPPTPVKTDLSPWRQGTVSVEVTPQRQGTSSNGNFSVSELRDSLKKDPRKTFFLAWASRTGIRLEDLRPKQGALWAYTDSKESMRTLVSLGFQYNDKRKAFWFK